MEGARLRSRRLAVEAPVNAWERKLAREEREAKAQAERTAKAERRVEQLERWRAIVGEVRGKDPEARAALRGLEDELLEAYLFELQERNREDLAP